VRLSPSGKNIGKRFKVDDERYGEHNYHPEGRVEDIIVLTFVPRSEWAEA